MKLLQHKLIQISSILIIGLAIGIAIPKSLDNTIDTEVTHQHHGLWSCSMHPQIISETQGSCPICGMDLTPISENQDQIDPNAILFTEDAARAAQLETYIVKEEELTIKKLELSGTLNPNNDKLFNELSYVEGRIEFLAITSTGVHLNKGDLIAKIYAPDLIAAHQELLSLYPIRDQEIKLYNAVVQKFKHWNYSNQQIQELIKQNKLLSSYPIYAQQSGTITELLISEGDWIKSEQTILSSVDLNSVWAELEIHESQMNHLKTGQEIEVVIEALGNKKIRTVIDFVDPLINTDKRIGRIRATLLNKNQELKPGMFITANIHQPLKDKLLRIPASAILWTGKESLVYVKSPNAPTYSLRSVKIQEPIEEWYTIASGLEVGEEIVFRGTFTIDAAAQLAGKRSMINR